MTTPTNPQDRATPHGDHHVLYECGICDELHPWDFDGDCRDDANRFGNEDDYAHARNVPVQDVEVREWSDRQCADAEEIMLLPATQPTGSPAARTPEDEPKANPPASAQGASVERVGRPFRPSGVQAGKPWIDCCDGARDVLLVQDGNGHRLAFRLADILANCQPI